MSWNKLLSSFSLSFIFYIMFQSYLFWVYCFTKPTNWESVACSSSSGTTSDTSYWKFKTIASEKDTICIICNCFKILITIKMDVQTTTSYLCNNIETNNPLQAWWVGPRSASQHRLYIISYSYNTYFGCQRYPRPEVGSDTLCRHHFEHNTMDGASSIMPA